METIDILKNNELFKGLQESDIKVVAELTTKKIVQKNTIVISEGDTSSSMYLIKQGKVNVTLTNDEGKEMILSTLQQGDNFGELSLLDDDPRSANVIALEKCEFIVLHKSDFYQLLSQHPAIAISVIKYLCQRVRFITNIAQSLALLDVYGRLVKLLQSLASPSEDGRLIVSLPLTHKDIASRVGSSREMISRIMSELEKGQYLTTENKIITLNKKLPSAW
jgi:CRP/FNR family transcriptional regulator, cyclic AMP receptor protein